MRFRFLAGLAALATALVFLAALAACEPASDAVEPLRSTDDGAAASDRAAEPTDTPTPAPTDTPTPAPSPAAPSADVATALASLDTLIVAPRGSGTDYDRGDWPHWNDADRDCQNTRAEVLIAESQASVAFADGEECRVIAGHWVGPWSGIVFTDAGKVDIDHHVPLGHAHVSGGWQWGKERRRAYANDLSNPASLQTTSASLNRSKGKQPPDAWRPPERAAWCRYAADWILVKAQWELTVTTAEVGALRAMLDTCDAPGSWGFTGPATQ